VTSGLGHPNIVQVFDFSTTPSGEPFLVMEYLQGEDLDRRLDRGGRLSPEKVVTIIKQVASALAATHVQGIVHRDLKPANIFLLEVAGARDFVKVLDFGISKVSSAPAKLTRTSTLVGTPHYMSPEQAQGWVDEVDERTDQWALACIIWKSLTGRCPFVGENVPSILFQIVHQPPPPLLPLVPGLPAIVEEVLLRALEKNKSRRFPSVAQFSETLEDALTGAVFAQSETTSMAEEQESKLSTFSQSAAMIERETESPRSPKSTWIWGTVAVLAFLLGGTFLVLGLESAKTSTSAKSPRVVRVPAPPVVLPVVAPTHPTPTPVVAPEIKPEPPATPEAKSDSPATPRSRPTRQRAAVKPTAPAVRPPEPALPDPTSVVTPASTESSTTPTRKRGAKW
jgi:eukaryotic-like serine/threonine-protein kinase